MTTTKTIQEDKLLVAARLLDEEELNRLVDFVNFLARKKEKQTIGHDDKEKFINFLENIRDKAAQRGLTAQILENLLAEDE